MLIKKYFLGTVHARLGSSLRCGLRLQKRERQSMRVIRRDKSNAKSRNTGKTVF